MERVLANGLGDLCISPVGMLLTQPNGLRLPRSGEHLRHDMDLLLRRHPTKRRDLHRVQRFIGMAGLGIHFLKEAIRVQRRLRNRLHKVTCLRAASRASGGLHLHMPDGSVAEIHPFRKHRATSQASPNSRGFSPSARRLSEHRWAKNSAPVLTTTLTGLSRND